MMQKSLWYHSKTHYVIAITSIDTASIPYFSTSDITPSQWNFNSANIHTWTAFHITKLISGRKKKKIRNVLTFHNHVSEKGYYYSWGLCGWLTWHANNWKGTSQIRWVKWYFTNQWLKIHCITETQILHIFIRVVKLQLPVTVPATVRGKKNKIKLRFSAETWCYWRMN